MQLVSIDNARTMTREFLARVTIARAYRSVFATPDGERVLRDILRRNFVLETTTVEGDPNLSARNEGRRVAVLEILDVLRWNPMDMIKLANERENDETAA